MAQTLFDFDDVYLQVFIPFELRLHRHGVLRVSNLPVVHCLKVLLKMIQLGPQILPLGFDACETLLSVDLRVERILALHFLQLCFLLVAQRRQIFCRQPVRAARGAFLFGVFDADSGQSLVAFRCVLRQALLVACGRLGLR